MRLAPASFFGVRPAPAWTAPAVLLAALLVAVPGARASSVFSVGGLGEPSLEENARLRALGGAGVAEFGPASFSLVNPASIAEARFLALEATMLATRRSISTSSYGGESAYETSFPSIRLVIRMPLDIGLGGSYVAGTNGDFEVVRPESSGAASFLHIEGTGGLSFARVTLARRLTRRLRAGVDFDVVAGSYREEWIRSFGPSTLAQSRDTLETSWERLGRWRFGLQYGRERFSVGAVYETERKIGTTYEQQTAGSVVRTTGTLTYPSGLAAGFGLSLGDRTRFVGQYRRRNWNNDSVVSDLVDFRAEERYSLGYEKQPLGVGSILNKMPIRLGVTYLCWPDLLPRAGAVDVTGGTAHLDEWAVSLGTGIRTPDRLGTVDVSLDGGQRGNQTELGARETFFRIAISVKVSDETWR